MYRKIITEPSSEPVSTAEAKSHLIVEHAADDSLIAALITAARQNVEDRLNRVLVRQKWRLYLDDFMDEIGLEPWTVREVESVNYIDTTGDSQVLATSVYDFDLAGQRILKAYNQTWPDVRDTHNGVWIDVWAGYYTETTSPVVGSVPEAIKVAIKMMVAWMYEHRTPVSEVELYHNDVFDCLLAPYRVIRL